MTRKRSSYRPRPVVCNPIAFAIDGARPVSDEKRLKVKAARDMSLIAYAEARAAERDIAIFEGAMLLAHELALVGIGVELLEICEQASDVLADCRRLIAQQPDRADLGPVDFNLLRELCDLLDLQCQSVPLSQFEVCQRRAMHAAERGEKTVSA